MTKVANCNWELRTNFQELLLRDLNRARLHARVRPRVCVYVTSVTEDMKIERFHFKI